MGSQLAGEAECSIVSHYPFVNSLEMRCYMLGLGKPSSIVFSCAGDCWPHLPALVSCEGSEYVARHSRGPVRLRTLLQFRQVRHCVAGALDTHHYRCLSAATSSSPPCDGSARDLYLWR